MASSEVMPRFLHVLKSSTISRYYFSDKKDFDKRIDKSLIRLDTIRKSILVMCWASFEEFLRELIIEEVERRNGNGWNSVPLPDSVCSQHTLACAEVVTKIVHGSHRLRHVDSKRVSRDMCNLYCGDSERLNSEALAAFSGKFDKDSLARIGERIGVEFDWTTIGDCHDLRKISGIVGKREVGKWVSEQFCNIRDDRNSFAHGASNAASFEEVRLNEHLHFIRALAGRLCSIVDSNYKDESKHNQTK